MIDLIVGMLATCQVLYFWFTQPIFMWPRYLLSKCGKWTEYVVNCPICMSVWVAGGVYLAWLWIPWLVWVLAWSLPAIYLRFIFHPVGPQESPANGALTQRVEALKR